LPSGNFIVYIHTHAYAYNADKQTQKVFLNMYK